MLLPVVIAGGVGSRLWPVSRALLPKQFIQLPERDHTLFQETVLRLQGLSDLGSPLVVCNGDHRFLAAEQLRQLGVADANIMLEPVGRNTAPALALAALQATSSNKDDPVMLVLPADHVIKDKNSFHDAVSKGLELADNGSLVTFGVVPVAPETGYGYIECGEALSGANAWRVHRFEEKPDSSTAQQYLEGGRHLWNSGMFMFRASVYLSQLNQFAPDIYLSCKEAFEGIDKSSSAADFISIPENLFAACRSDSIDYAVMEKTEKAAVVSLDAGWNDLGSWDSIWETQESKDENENSTSGDVLLSGVNRSLVYSQSKLIAAIGVEDLVIVETTDAMLVAAKTDLQAIKNIVQELEQHKRPEVVNHAKVYRPWGSYESLVHRPGYQVKHIVVEPGASLSLQLHNHRAEHWTMVKGTGQMTLNDETVSLSTNESIFIPVGAKHRLANPGSEPIELVEVQIGDYLGEDDIIRFDDVYGRSDKSC